MKQFGVGHIRTASVSDVPACIAPVIVVWRAEPRESPAVTVGQDEDAEAALWQASFSRAVQARRIAVTHSAQVLQDVTKPAGNVSFDVLEEAPARSNNVNCVTQIRPQPTLVFLPLPTPRRRIRLARIAPDDAVNAASKAGRWEGGSIRPDRCRCHETQFHLRNQVRAGVRFPLHASDDAQRSESALKSELQAAIAGEKAEHSG